MESFNGFGDFGDDLDNAKISRTDEKYTGKRFTCTACNGTGFYNGVRVHQHKEHCFACRGQGFFKTDPEVRAKNRAQAKARRENKSQQILKENTVAIGGAEVLAWLDRASWSGFYMDLSEKARKYVLSEKQAAVIVSGYEKHLVRQQVWEEEKAKRDAARPTVDLSVIHNLFATAQANGLKKPRLRFEGLAVSLAPAHGVNAGHLYVKANGEYAGKITPDHKAKIAPSYAAEVLPKLQALAATPLEALVAHGRKTGECACCGRELTNKESIDRGIGPICASKWGL